MTTCLDSLCYDRDGSHIGTAITRTDTAMHGPQEGDNNNRKSTARSTSD